LRRRAAAPRKRSATPTGTGREASARDGFIPPTGMSPALAMISLERS
jgi:hypothetical protein